MYNYCSFRQNVIMLTSSSYVQQFAFQLKLCMYTRVGSYKYAIQPWVPDAVLASQLKLCLVNTTLNSKTYCPLLTVCI